jgi:transposase-like protein
MKKVSVPQVVTAVEAVESSLPPEIQEALGELVGAAREGLLALSVGVGLGVVHELMELEVAGVVGPKGKHDPGRTAKRHGHEDGSMTLGGRRVQVSRPRMRTADDERELPVSTYEHFADRDPLTRAVMNRMLAGVSSRKFAGVGEPVGEEVQRSSTATSKTSVSEMFIERTRTALGELMGRRLEDVRVAVMMLDGLEIAGRTHIVALGISTEGVKIPLGLWEGSTENATLARTLLADLVDRGLDPEQAILFVIDGGKAIRRAIKDVFGERALVHRCHRHKERNVCDLLPERDRPAVLAKIRGAWALKDADLAEQRLELLASELDRTWPDAAASLREGMPETLTLMRLAITGGLAKTLCSTNPCESMIEIVRRTQRNVKRWQDGDTRKRWTAAGMLVAEQQFRRIIGYRDLAKLVAAIERHTARAAPSNPRHRRSRRDTTNRYCLTVKSRRPLPKFHHDPDILRHVAGSCSRPQCEPFLLNQQDHAQPAMRGQRSVSVLHSGPSLRS